MARALGDDLPVSVLDVLEGFFGGVPELEAVRALTLGQVDELGELVTQSAESLALQREGPSELGELVYPGGWLARGWGQELFRVELNCALLYEPRLLIHDPLAEYYFASFNTLPKMRSIKGRAGSIVYGGPDLWANHGRRVHRGDDIDGIRADLVRIVRFLVDVEPLIRSGVVALRSQWPTIRRCQRHLMASCIADMASPKMLMAAGTASFEGGLLPRWDNVRGLQVTPPGGLLNPDDPAQWEPEFFYLAKTLAVADAAGAVYAPASPDELRLLVAKTSAIPAGRRAAPSVPVLREVLSVLVPDLTLSPAAAVKIRDSEASFEDWRRSLRDIQREATTTDEADIEELVEDRLRPQVNAVTKAVGGSAALRKYAGKSIAATLITAGASAITGAPLAPSVAAGALTGVAGWLQDAYAARRLDGSRALIATLLRSPTRGTG